MIVGAGVSEIVFPQEMFPEEGFSGEANDSIHARVLVINNNIKVAIVSLELVNIPEELIENYKQVLFEKTNTPVNNVWIHATHSITTPHMPASIAARDMYMTSIAAAVARAAQQAADSCQAATMGVGVGYCDVNANRDIELNGKWYHGLGSKRASNKTMTILRFDAMNGDPIGFLISYGVKPACIDNIGMDINTRKISADIPGAACTMIEEKMGAPALFCMSAAGDQIPKEIANYFTLDTNGEIIFFEHTVAEGIDMMERQGIEMGNSALRIAKGIVCDIADPAIAAAAASFTWPGKAGDSEVSIVVECIHIGDNVAFVGLKPEMNCVTEFELLGISPFEHTLIMSFLNGSQKYMPEAKAYELETWEFKRAGMAVGCAEEFVRVASGLLKSLHESCLS